MTDRTYTSEFPDFPPADMPAIPADWQDESWHNDSCPSFYAPGKGVRVFVDYADPDLRDIPDMPRFSVHRVPCGTVLFQGDDWQGVLAFLAGYQPRVKKADLAEVSDIAIAGAARTDDLDDAVRQLQELAGITDGGVAGLAFSGTDGETAWAGADHAGRVRMLRDWLALETVHADA